MRGSKAKRIRRAIYGDQSLRHDGKYIVTKEVRRLDRTGKEIINRTIANAPNSLRALYLKAKKEK